MEATTSCYANALLLQYVEAKARNLALLREMAELKAALSEARQQSQRLEAAMVNSNANAAMLAPNTATVAATRPTLVLSTHRLFRHRQFALHFVAPRGWLASRGITTQQLYEAGTRATVRLEAHPERQLRQCGHCSPRPIVVVTAATTDPAAFTPLPCGPAYERLTWDACQSNCTSSRDHHRSRLFLRVELPRGLGHVDSLPFKCLSRDKRCSRAERAEAAQPVLAPGTAFGQLSYDMPSPPLSSPVHHYAFLIMRVYRVSVGSAEVETVTSAYKALMEKRPGFIRHETRMMNNCFASFLWCNSGTCEAASPSSSSTFIHTPAMNPAGIDLVAHGLVTEPIAFHSGSDMSSPNPWVVASSKPQRSRSAMPGSRGKGSQASSPQTPIQLSLAGTPQRSTLIAS